MNNTLSMNAQNEIKMLGRNISHMRKLKSLSQEELSFSAKIARSTLQNIESGKVDPHFSTLYNLAKALEVDVTEFFYDIAPSAFNPYN